MDLLTVLMAAAGLVVAQAHVPSAPGTLDSARLRAVCVAVEKRALDLNEDTPFTYEYEPALWQLAGAVPDSDELSVAQQKIAQLWNTRRAELVCERDGKQETLLRFAVRHDFLELIEDLSEKYHLHIDVTDPSDGKTLMEFIASELSQTKGSIDTPAQRRLGGFYDYVKKAQR